MNDSQRFNMSLRQLRTLVRIAQFCGLLPLAVRYQPIHARPSRLATLYSIAIGCTIVPLTSGFLALFFWSILMSYAAQGSFLFTAALAWILSEVQVACAYVLQLRNRHTIVRLFNEAMRIRVMFMLSYGTMYTAAAFLDRRCRRLVWLKLGSVAVQLVFIMLAVWAYDVGPLRSPVLRVLMKLVMLVGIDAVMVVYSTMHFAMTVVALQFYRECNLRLTECVGVVQESVRDTKPVTVATTAPNLAKNEVIEDIERVALLYCKTSEFVLEANALFAWPMVLTLINSFLYILVSLYNLVHDMSKLANFEASDQPPQVLLNVFCLLYFGMRVYFVVLVSDAVIEEASKTGRILCRTASFRVDRALKETIELFSLSILQGDKLMTVCGLFSVDKTLIYGMVGALTSYLTILIQFDLAGSSSKPTVANATA